MKTILHFVTPYRGRLALVGVLYMLATLAGLFMPYLMSDIVNVGIRGRNMEYILARGGLMLLLAALALLCSLWTTKLNAGVTAGFTEALQTAVFQKINSLTFEEYAGIGTASLLTRSTDDVFAVQNAANSVVYAVVTVPVLFIGGAVLAFSRDWLLSLVLILLAPVVLLIVCLVTRRLDKLWDNSDRYIDMQNRVVRERLSGIRVIRAFDKEAHEHRRAAFATEEMAKNIIKANVRMGMINPVSILLLNLCTVAMLYIGAVRMQAEPLMQAGDVIATIQYVALMMNGLLVLSWTFAWLPQIRVSVRRIAEVLRLPGQPAETAQPERLAGSLRLSHVTFRYPGAETAALTDVSMEVPEGQIVAVIGGTGSGKTTLMKLLLAFYPPSEGEIRLGERAYDSLSRETVRDNFAVALQKSMIFEGTLAENIRMGNPGASDAAVESAARDSQLADFIASHAEGLAYPLAQAGSNLSGGQKQRVNIARTIVRDAAVYVFDDSFSALDYLTESRLRMALNRRLSGKTQLIVTQRAATAMRCDRIYVLDRGRVVGAGTHEQLLERCTIYREIFDSQLGGAGA